MASVPEFETRRLVLRPITAADAPGYERYFIDYDVVAPLSSAVPWPVPPGAVLAFFEEAVLPRQGQDRWFWGLYLKSSPDELVGAVDLWRPGVPENRGFWLARHLWGQGLMTEAVEPVTCYAFEELGFDELVFTNAVGNVRSRRIKEKTGAMLETVKPGDFVDPKYTEQEIWKLTKSAWQAHRKATRQDP